MLWFSSQLVFFIRIRLPPRSTWTGTRFPDTALFRSAYLERGREWLQERGQRVRDQAELAAHGMASLVQGAARTMRAGLQTSTGDGFDALPALDHSPRQQQTPALDHGQDERDQQRQRQHDRDGPDIGFSR